MVGVENLVGLEINWIHTTELFDNRKISHPSMGVGDAMIIGKD